MSASPDPFLRKFVTVSLDEPMAGINIVHIGMTQALDRLGVREVHPQRFKAVKKIAQLAKKAGLIRPLVRYPQTSVIAVLAWVSDRIAFPYGYWREMIPWVFDCWGPQLPAWEALLRKHRVRTAFFSARQASEHFARVIPGLQSFWLPEACVPSLYDASKPLRDRSLHVLEMGRKLEDVHDAIKGPLADARKKHVYATHGVKTVLFPGLDALLAAQSDTAVLMCFPKTMTHPDDAGGIETVTQRYFESIAAGCLTVGHAPRELVDLFGFNPVIELDTQSPASHMMNLLSNLESQQAHVDKSRARLLEVGTFDARAAQMIATLRELRSGR